MSISCLRIRSSSRSSGPSYTSTTETAKGESLSSFFSGFTDLSSDSLFDLGGADGFATSTRGTDCCALSSGVIIPACILLGIFHHRWLIRKRHPHSLAHIVHGLGRRLLRLLRACLQNIPSQLRILLEFLAPLLHRTQKLH